MCLFDFLRLNVFVWFSETECVCLIFFFSKEKRLLDGWQLFSVWVKFNSTNWQVPNCNLTHCGIYVWNMLKPTDVENIIFRVWDQSLRKNGSLSNLESYWQNTNLMHLCYIIVFALQLISRPLFIFPQFVPTGIKSWPSTHQLDWNVL